MKPTLFVTLILLFSRAVFAQTTTIPESYSDTVSITGTKNEIYIKAKEYFATTTAVTKNDLQLDDKDLGKLIAKSTTTQDQSLGGLIALHFEVNYTTSISVKDNKYKYVISDIFYDKTNVTPLRAEEIIGLVIDELKKFMSTKSQTDF